MIINSCSDLKSKPFKISITGNYYALLLPREIIQPFLDQDIKRIKAKAAFEGKELDLHAAFQKRNGNYYMMFRKRYQKELDIFPNDSFQLQFFEDDSKYGVEMPEELQAVLMSNPEAFQIFEAFTPGKQPGIIYGVLSYKVSQTRTDKSILICENPKRGIRHNLDLLQSF